MPWHWPSASVSLISSSLPSTCRVDESHKKRLQETISFSFYNKTKCGVDVCDQMVRQNTTKAESRRWLVHVFYNLLDFGGINSWNLFTQATKQKIKRSDFLLGLGEQLCERFSSLKNGGTIEEQGRLQLRRKCQVPTHYNMTKVVCSECDRFCCGTCVASKKTVVVCCKYFDWFPFLFNI